ncbi:LysE family translocator [Amycolatopsis magusensis]|uniref:Threonine/homoserine/homoserine lactone efflux protein n=1 Tax=Amycolatopsis magusensis TaxID=882444 RepID=A0ABS4PYI7_9PSEU|nr:LysE family translocator [Amycolatopsis magusensis]MBP2184378.1 threonine/homoserine/homoserine lactone efflux protein [Amycolatopsis magusensis]
MELGALLGFAGACVVLNLVPGPGMMFIIAHGVGGGRSGGVAAALGMASGTMAHTVAAALGLSALLRAAPAALEAVKIAGAVFLLYLAVSTLISARKPAALAAARGSRRSTLRKTYLSAVLTNLANPKVVLFYLAFVPQFLTPGGWAVSAQILVLGAVLIVIGLVMDGAVGLAAGTFSALVLRKPKFQRRLKEFSAVIFGGLALRLLTEN